MLYLYYSIFFKKKSTQTFPSLFTFVVFFKQVSEYIHMRNHESCVKTSCGTQSKIQTDPSVLNSTKYCLHFSSIPLRVAIARVGNYNFSCWLTQDRKYAGSWKTLIDFQGFCVF